MSDAAFAGLMLLMLAGGAAGALLLRHAWRLREGKTPWRLAGWATLVFTMVWPAFALGPARGPFIAITLISAAAFAVVASSLQVRAAKTPRAARARASGGDSLAPEPAERPTTPWRTTLRWLLAGPIGMVAAMGIGICYAVWMPGETQTRLLIGGLIVPVVWGAAMAWTLADSRILRATAVLVGTAVVGFTLAILKGL
ncbi:hypothetical protein L6Q21_12365 [Sandaracinobacter sp. RS1-74]|uniref:hypothetical protein n=1 Tax=Sandaracinobacteroides sayramensis TaxID=2913411 RepID=UPI001EDAA2B5|nr:hypothetical protein [Sandaracinobacteroides sayramensis]MCG2841777.1 hypothetical protein [Sandaracinobacteroides sayramensis]